MANRHERRMRAWRFQQDRIQKRINLLAGFRLVTFVIILLSVSFSIGGDYVLVALSSTLVSSLVFLYLMGIHDRCYRFKNRCEVLENLAKNDAARVEHRFDDIVDVTQIQFPVGHPFAHDLDLTGRNSLLKLLDDSHHKVTKERLAGWIDNIDTPDVIRERQEAVAELAPKKRFRLKLGMAARLDSDVELKPDDLKEWLEMPMPWTLKTGVWIFGRLLSVVTTTVVVLAFSFLTM